MNDDVQPSDTPSDELVAVSAVADGTATADERALVEASPELTEQVVEMQSHRQAIASVEVTASVREVGITAALAAFDELHGAVAPVAAAAVASTNVVSLERRRRLYRVVTGAAAAVIVVVVGVAALNNLSGSDDDDSATMADTAATVAKASEADDAAGGADEADTAVALSESAPADTAAPAMSGAPLPVEADSAATEAPAATDAPAEAPTSTIGEIPGPAAVPPPIDDDGELATYAATTPQTRNVATDSCVPAGDETLGQVNYQGQLADVGRADDDGEISVYAADDCSVLTTIRP